jgi:hypothetical protein
MELCLIFDAAARASVVLVHFLFLVANVEPPRHEFSDARSVPVSLASACKANASPVDGVVIAC